MGEQLVIKETGALMLWIVICLLAAFGLTIWLLRRPRHAVSSQTSTTGVQSLTIRAQQTIARLEDERTAAELEANVLAAELAYAAHALDCSRLQQMRRESIAVADRWYEQTRTAIAMQREVNTSYQGLKRNVDALYEQRSRARGSRRAVLHAEFTMHKEVLQGLRGARRQLGQEIALSAQKRDEFNIQTGQLRDYINQRCGQQRRTG